MDQPVGEVHFEQSEGHEPGRTFSPRRRLNIATALALAVLIAVTASWWLPLVRQGWQNLFPYTGPIVLLQSSTHLMGLRASDGGAQWSMAPVESDNRFYAQGGVMYTEALPSRIEAIRERDGHVLWNLIPAAGTSFTLVGVDASHQLYYWIFQNNQTTSTLVAANLLTGATEWKTQLPAEDYFLRGSAQALMLCSMTSTATAGNAARITTIDAQTGKVLWSTAIAIASKGYRPYACFPLGDVATVIDDRQVVHAFDLQTGRPLWQAQAAGNLVGYNQGTLYFSTAGLTTSPQGQSLTAIALQTGQQQWKIPGMFSEMLVLSASGSNAFPAGIVPMLTATGIAGIASGTGAVAWRVALSGYDPSSLACGSGDRLYVGGASAILAIDGSAGAIRWTTPLGDQAVSLLCQSDALYVSTFGETARLDPQSGHVLWHQAPSGLIIDVS